MTMVKDTLYLLYIADIYGYSITETLVDFDILLYEYRDLFIDMAVRNNRSELAIANRHQER